MLISNSKVSGIGDKCMVPLLVMGECGWCGKVDYINNEWSCWRRRRRTDVSSSGTKRKVHNTRSVAANSDIMLGSILAAM